MERLYPQMDINPEWTNEKLILTVCMLLGHASFVFLCRNRGQRYGF